MSTLPLGDHLLDLSWRPGFAGGIGEVGSVVGEDSVDLARDSLNPVAQEVPSRAASHLLVQFDEGELRRPVDCDDEIELTFSGSHLGEVNMEIADGIGLELALGRGFAFDLRQPRYSVALKAAMQRRARQMRNRRLKRVETVVERQQTMPSKGDDHGLLFNGQNG
jgi:hypothetical protein